MYTIMVIEDDAVVRDTLTDLLNDEGFSVISASDALRALIKLKEEIPDLIVCDIMMPLMDGFQFYKRVRNEYLDKNIPFIFLTAKTDYESREIAMEMGADDFITKPYNPDKLVARINKRLEKKKALDERFHKLTNDISLYVPHELRTPLIPILGFTDMLLSDFDSFSDEEKIDMISAIRRGGLRFKDRIEKFNLYSELKIEELSGNYFEEKEIVCNPYILKEFIFPSQSYQCEDRTKDISVNLESAPIKISELSFKNLFNELLENSCKFSNPGTPIIVSGKKNDKMYHLVFENYGDKFEISKVGEFYQKERDRIQQEGNGLGLAIVKMLAKKYNFKLKVNFEETNRIIVEFQLAS